LRGASATKQSRIQAAYWIASLALAMTIDFDDHDNSRLIVADASATIE
jgi:hypothetical protein